MFHKLRFYLLGLLLGVWALAACAPALPTSTADQPAAAPTAATDMIEPAAETEASSQPMVTVRQELGATDPAGVSLASGKVQLVEFFAFW